MGRFVSNTCLMLAVVTLLGSILTGTFATLNFVRYGTTEAIVVGYGADNRPCEVCSYCPDPGSETGLGPSMGGEECDCITLEWTGFIFVDYTTSGFGYLHECSNVKMDSACGSSYQAAIKHTGDMHALNTTLEGEYLRDHPCSEFKNCGGICYWLLLPLTCLLVVLFAIFIGCYCRHREKYAKL